MIVGKSTCGRGDTGSRRRPMTPDRASPMVRSVVATGLLMKMGGYAHVGPTGWSGPSPSLARRFLMRPARRSKARYITGVV